MRPAAGIVALATKDVLWTKPWTAVIHLKQTEDQIYEFVCHEGNNQPMAGMLGGACAEEKAAEEAAKDRPKLPQSAPLAAPW